VNGSLQVVSEFNVGGTGTSAGSLGTAGQLLVSNGPNQAPKWQTPAAIKGAIANAYYIQGTSLVSINSGSTADVPGVTVILTVPAGLTQTLLFNVVGYASLNPTGNSGSQGVFALLQNGTKISSAYASSANAVSLSNLPVPATLLKAVTLTEGTYTFKVQYSAWAGNQRINYVPSDYSGYNGDKESMLTKTQILVYNN